jgi:RNA polymerase sigma-32 factor
VSGRKSLDENEEAELAGKWQASGDKRALSRLVEAHLSLVICMAQELSRGAIPLDDLIQEGNIGLTIAAQKFDPSREVRLVTYATYWIRAYMMRYVLRTYGPVRIDTTRPRRKIFYRLGRARRQLEANGEEVDAAAIARHIGVPERDVEALLPYLTAQTISIESPENVDEARRHLEGALSLASPEADITDRDAQGDLAEKVRKALRTLDKRERKILEERYLKDSDGATLRALAKSFGVSPERVRQLEIRAKEKLKARLLEAGVDEKDLL